MIRIRKPAAPPRVLTGRGRVESGRNRAAYVQDPASFDTGASSFEFDSKLYGHETVKRSLVQAQHGKCCFCEAKITHIAYGDVEHFRPKVGYRQLPDDPLGRPGYYWLAYDWSNLYLSCQLCNQRFKKNAFPLLNDSRRCRNHLGDIALEEPLFIDPGETDPEEHIEFVGEQPVAKDGSARGQATIRALGLQREPLRERRFDRYRILAALKDVALLMPGDPLGQQALDILRDAVEDQAEYAAMARCLMRKS
jgi:uncharacterized protein (TIGR02646 family)